MRTHMMWRSPHDPGIRVDVVIFSDAPQPQRPRVESAYPLPGPEPQFRVIKNPRAMIYTRDLGQVEKFLGAKNFESLVEGK